MRELRSTDSSTFVVILGIREGMSISHCIINCFNNGRIGGSPSRNLYHIVCRAHWAFYVL